MILCSLLSIKIGLERMEWQLDIAIAPNLSRTHIILINADDLSASTLGCYGQQIIRTPRLDSMAKEGILFLNGYSPATTCGPSRVSLLTGLHTGHIEFRKNQGDRCRINEDIVCFPELLQQYGYHTAQFGKASNAKHLFKYPVGNFPSDDGFDLFIGTVRDATAHQFYLDGVTAPQNDYPEHLWKDDGSWWLKKYPISPTRYTQNEYIDLALKYIEENKNHPFFLYLPLQIPHWELVVPRKGDPDYHPEDEGLIEQYLKVDGSSMFDEKPYLGTSPNFKRHEPQPKATYAAMISRLDRDVGKIIDLLKILKIDENTLVIFTADNGFAGIPGGDPFRCTGGEKGNKANLYQGGIHVPYIFWGGGIQHREIEEAIVGYDLGVTILDIVGIRDEFKTDGISWKEALYNDKMPNRKYIYWENYHGKTRQAALIDSRYKVVKSAIDSVNYSTALYDLSIDYQESRDLSKVDSFYNVLKFADKVFSEEHIPFGAFVIDP